MLVIDPKVYSLIKVAETGSYTRAAEQLSLTQPAVSQHIRALEGELGIRIFERVNNELRITHEGETAIKYAKRMLSLYNLSLIHISGNPDCASHAQMRCAAVSDEKATIRRFIQSPRKRQ